MKYRINEDIVSFYAVSSDQNQLNFKMLKEGINSYLSNKYVIILMNV